ncbi:TPA: cell division protein FtsK, partial [Streptococcus equi subsp. equi]|nr:cell division protein FtsK [Streptococcus equi subsp. equi]
MARRTQRQKNPPKRRLTKAELEKQKAIKRMIASFSCALLLVFAMLRLGALGVTLYNLIRFMVGDLANLLMLAVLFYLFFFKWLRQKDGLIAGFIILFLGLLVEWHAYLFSLPQLAHQAIVAGTIQLITNDLLAFKVSEFVGGGMLGAM